MQFSREDWTLFRSLNTLPQKAGVPLSQLGAVAVKELVDNALDAGAKVSVTEEGNSIIITDDGPGISHETLATLFSIHRPLTSSKIVRLPQRGALGNGLRVVMGVVFASEGAITVETGGHDDDMQGFRLVPQPDGHTAIAGTFATDLKKGTRITLTLGKALRAPGHMDPMHLAKLSTVFSEFGTKYKGKTSPWWYDGEAFFEMCHAAGVVPLAAVLNMFRDIKPESIELLINHSGFDSGIKANEMSRVEATIALENLRKLSKAPTPGSLGNIGDLHGNFRAKEIGIITHGGGLAPVAEIPFVIEVFAKPMDGDIKGNDEADSILFMVNRTRIAGEIRSYRTKPTELVMHGCGLAHRFKVPKSTPVQLIINITTPYCPITTDGKEPDLRRYVGYLTKAINKAAAKCKRAENRTQQGKLSTQRTVIIKNLQAGIDKASGGGKYRYSLRQLYYAVRPYVLATFDKLDYNYFGTVITEIEGARGSDLPNMYRDPRGYIYHPHTQQEIPLGTLQVEEYERPAWTFNKILYCEKKGFLSLLRSIGWPERNDCALMSSEGFASRAARDVIDLIGETQEEIYFFCVHDADASGTMIYQSLLEATKARGARTVHIINLGLDPDEADEMGLEVETFREAGGKKLPVAAYLKWEWREWLRTQRVELNAMTSPEFIEWIDGKFAKYEGKIVPPNDVLDAQFHSAAEKALREGMTTKVLAEGDFEPRVQVLIDKVTVPEGLEETVRGSLLDIPEQRWDAPVGVVAKEEADRLVLWEKKS